MTCGQVVRKTIRLEVNYLSGALPQFCFFTDARQSGKHEIAYGNKPESKGTRRAHSTGRALGRGKPLATP